MDNLNGLIYLHNLAGQALAAANAEIQALRAEVADLREQLSATGASPEGHAHD